MARSCGIKRDLRQSKLDTYANYFYLNFRSYIGQHGDCYDRFLIRMNEMSESLNIINQSINKISKYNIHNNNANFTNSTNILPHVVLKYLDKKNFSKKNNYNNMELLINHFKK
jgi:NADH:ubiquinone oxidoreductase subunit D